MPHMGTSRMRYSCIAMANAAQPGTVLTDIPCFHAHFGKPDKQGRLQCSVSVGCDLL